MKRHDYLSPGQGSRKLDMAPARGATTILRSVSGGQCIVVRGLAPLMFMPPRKESRYPQWSRSSERACPSHYSVTTAMLVCPSHVHAQKQRLPFLNNTFYVYRK